MISAIFHTVLYKPLYNGLLFLTDVLPFNDVGFAIILLTLVVRFIIFPLSHRSIVTQKKMKEIEPEISKVKKKIKDKQQQAQEIMRLYREHGISPFSGFLMILVQLPIFIALFMLLRQGVLIEEGLFYSFVDIPEKINFIFLGLIDLSKASYVLSALAAASQFFQMKLTIPKIKKTESKERSFKNELQKSMSVQMKYVMPVFIFFIAQRFSSGMALYWTTSNVFAIVHEMVVARKAKKLKEKNDGNGRKKDKN
ncbi:MAG: hypothetical protein COT67_01940 [Candidatus Tagabacteria bacterium CG09_land_8_20_14_0_10_41_14]|uniref:Membrane insertase YidC/Oxa/ALB C-terminal domain-containing protein n=2 Tax=Candidatus Tagaibacteriota TaxID=1817918 RepID=A0A2H0WLA6_9BACT|nr:MAG: hypothetical protein COT67_01940 [Candidatus Tagabacteria bacterium CG09_land_8_20_14_0_10_41_14]PJE73213.1 MAG: hypothetical protein COV00_01090 [Candidatus Tagabacteria bacterium CG10_big_fil_rev_8_21_14_0_10_40_13]